MRFHLKKSVQLKTQWRCDVWLRKTGEAPFVHADVDTPLERCEQKGKRHGKAL